MASVNSAIKIFCRVKPSQEPLTAYDVLTENSEEMLQLCLREEHPFTAAQAYLNHKPEQYKFRFTKVFDRTSPQEYVFQEVAKPVIESALQGYNGTIFAYGQTGTGKTYTMTGSRTNFNERGIIPRALEHIFQRFDEEKNPAQVRNVFVSYLEIYNEAGYDLLNPSTVNGRMDDLGRVSLMEDGSQQMHLRNLSVHSIETVEEATQYLYLGDHNRTIAETPLNEVSTRSHCIFTVHLSMRDVNTSLTTRSKLHLVDLAGSERVSTICTTSQLASEARHINLALHYLEQVIVALGDSQRSHIPYRNSMMTSVLRDSLGGNCMTSMIATIALEPRNTQETLSTCRFSQRVALVTNAVQRNEDLDPNIIIDQLKSEIKKLRQIIESTSGKPLSESKSALNDDELAVCSYSVQQYIIDNDPNVTLPVLNDMRMIKECFRLMKSYINSRAIGPIDISTANKSLTPNQNSGEDIQFVNDKNLPQLLARRDAEIKVLMDMIRKEKTKRSVTANPSCGDMSLEHSPKPRPPISSRSRSIEDDKNQSENRLVVSRKRVESSTSLPVSPSGTRPSSSATSTTVDGSSLEESSMTQDFTPRKRVALVTFINKYEGTTSLESLRAKVFEKRIEIRNLETSISSLASNIESMKKIAETTDSGLDLSSLTSSLRNQERSLETNTERMKNVREEVDEIENVLKIEYRKLLDDFEKWWSKNSGTEVERKYDEVEEIHPNINNNHSVGTVFKKSGMEERLREEAEGNRRKWRGGGGGGSQQVSGRYGGGGDRDRDHRISANYPIQHHHHHHPPASTSSDNSPNQTDSETTTEDGNTSENTKGISILTGDEETDQEVLQFLEARKQVFKAMKQMKEQQSD